MNARGEKLVLLLQEKRHLLFDIGEDCKAQQLNILSDNLDAMEYIINRREERMRTIERLDAEFSAMIEPFRSSVRPGETSEEMYAETRTALHALTVEIRELCEEILKRDKENAVALENKMLESRSELKQVKDGQRLNQAYFSPYGESSRINDGY